MTTTGSERVVIYGGSFNPPGTHHRRIIDELLKQFDRVIVTPRGPRFDKDSTSGIDPVHRAAMTDLAFNSLDRVEVDLLDLEHATFTRTHTLEQRYRHLGEVWHAVEGDQVAGGATGTSIVQLQWEHGAQLWSRLRFAVIRRPGQACLPEDLPPHHRLLRADFDGSSYLLRERLFRGEDIEGVIPGPVARYISRHGLYRDGGRTRGMRFALDEPRVLIFANQNNARAMELAEPFQQYVSAENPNCVLVFGGDGTMLRAIQTHWRLRVPFFGVNAGHLGFLLNRHEPTPAQTFPVNGLISRHMPLLYVEMLRADGGWTSGLTFNDAWVERSTGQTAWMQVKVDGRTRIEKLVADGILVSTAAGSTAYARSMGASPLLADTPAWLLVGSNVMTPSNWQSALLSLDAEVEIRTLDDGRKRPLRGYLYGENVGEVTVMRARISRTAAVEIAFRPTHDIARKIGDGQFPPTETIGDAPS